MCRLSSINPYEAKLVTHNLGDIAYNHSYSERKSNRASNLLTKFSEALLLEHLTTSVDYGPDARRACASISRHIEWCFACLGIKACVEAFGVTIVASQSKNVASRFFSRKLRNQQNH